MSRSTAFATARNTTKANPAASGLRYASKLVPGENGAMKVDIDEAGWKPLMASHDSNRTGGPKNLPKVRETALTWANKVVAEIIRTGNPLMAADMIKAAINKRDPRNGEGEKLVGFTWLLTLYRHFPSTIVALLKDGVLIGTHGCWGDIEKLMKEIYASSAMTPAQMVDCWGPLVNGMRDSILAQRKQDLVDLDRFLKAVAPKGHWACGGIRAYESLDQCTIDGNWVLPHNMEKYKARLASVGKTGTLSKAELGRRPRWLALQKVISQWSKSDYLASIRDQTGSEVQPLTISYAGKWIGRENSDAGKIDKLYWWLNTGSGNLTKTTLFSYYLRSELKSKDAHGNMVPFSATATIPYGARKQFRVRSAALNACLDVTEVKMCADLWDRINFSRVTSICLARNNAAFLNELLKTPCPSYQEDTGNRHPESRTRVRCRENLRAFTTDPEKAEKLNAGACFPHHILHDIETASSTAKRDLHNARWTSLIAKIRSSQEEFCQKLADEAKEAVASATDSSAQHLAEERVIKAMGLGNFLPMIDISESMTWDHSAPERPIDIAVACGIALSSVSNDTWKGLAVSFTDNPYIHDIHSKGKDVASAKAEIYQHKGYSTNFYKAQMAVLDKMKSSGATDNDLPVIVVFTDGEWDSQDRNQPTGGWETMHQKVERQYAKAGFTRTPLIVYWNLKKGRNGVQTHDNHPGCIFLQGQSPNLFKWILYGESLPDTEKVVMADGKAVKVKTSSATPYSVFRKTMSADHLEAVEQVLLASREKELAGYTAEFAEQHMV